MSESARNYVSVVMHVEGGCNTSEGEYSLTIDGFVGGLDISSTGGADDISLIRDAIENNFDFTSIEDEVCVFFRLKESGEWEDVFWHKYYEIEKSEVHEYR